MLTSYKFPDKMANRIVCSSSGLKPVYTLILETEPVILMSGEAMGIEFNLLDRGGQVY